MTDDELKKISAAHTRALHAQAEMRSLANQRGSLIAAAINEGVSAADIAAALGVNRQRIYQMATQGRHLEDID